MKRAVFAAIALIGSAVVVASGSATQSATAAPSSYRVNAGGPTIAGTPPWSADTSAAPSPFVTATGGGGRRLSTTNAIVMRNPSLPPGTPVSLFGTARSANRLTWRFPVAAGTYSVRLYFAEIDPNRQTSDGRLFDVTVGNQLALDDFDIFAATGGYTGSMRSFVTTASSEVVVNMTTVTGPPVVSAVEVVPYVPPGAPAPWTRLPDSHYRRSEQTFAYSSVTGRFYLVGGIAKVEGMQVRRLEEYDPVTRRWATVATVPSTLNHVQAVELNGLIYYIGGWASAFLNHAFDPVTRRVTMKAKLPRGRAGGGVVAYQGRIYYAGGLDPSRNESTPWFSVYDPATNRWTELPDMPHARDHFGAAVIDGKLYTIGGRHVVREKPVVENDVYDFATGQWTTGLAPLPTERSGTATAVLGDEILVLGGERIWSQPAKRTVEAYHPATDTWRTLPDMAIGAHGIQAAVCNGGVYVAAGATTPGAKDPSTFFQVYFPGPQAPCPGTPAVRRAPRQRLHSSRSPGWAARAHRPSTASTARSDRVRRRTVLIRWLAVLAAVLALPACEPPPTRHYAYVVSQIEPNALRVYDVDDGHQLVRTVPLPELVGSVAGMGASSVTDRLFLTATGTEEEGGVLISYDLRSDEVVWSRTYRPGVDALCVTPDGSKVYMSSGEESGSDFFFVLDAADGDVLGTIPVARLTHNAVCNLDGTRAYLASITSPWVTMVDTSDDHVIRRIGPFGDSIRPFTINGRNTLTVVNVNRLIGFEVGDITTGQKLYRVPVPGYPNNGTQLNPSHGVGLTPDEREVWVVDSQHKAVHVFDVTGLPGQRPVKRATIALSKAPYWVTFSLDGRYAYPSTGDVIDTASRTKVATIIGRSTKQLQVDFRGNDPVRVASRHGIGYVTD